MSMVRRIHRRAVEVCARGYAHGNLVLKHRISEYFEENYEFITLCATFVCAHCARKGISNILVMNLSLEPLFILPVDTQ